MRCGGMMSTRNARGFAHLRQTFCVCFTFVTYAGSACATEVVLAGWSGNALLAAAQLAAGFGLAASIGIAAALCLSPCLDRFDELRTTRRSAVNAFALGTIVALPLLVNKLAR